MERLTTQRKRFSFALFFISYRFRGRARPERKEKMIVIFMAQLHPAGDLTPDISRPSHPATALKPTVLAYLLRGVRRRFAGIPSVTNLTFYDGRLPALPNPGIFHI